jgi:hypothetical protein
MRSFVLLLAIDVAIVALGIALFANPSPTAGAGASAGDAGTVADARRLAEEARALRARVARLEERVPPPAAPRPAPAAGATPSPPAATYPEEELDRLQAAIEAVEQRRARERAIEGLRGAVRHVFPDLDEGQQQEVAEAIVAYREILQASLGPGGGGAEAGHEAGALEMRRRLQGVVSAERAEEIVLRYAIRPGPPPGPPAVSPPIRRD